MEEWSTDPWTLTEIDNRLYGSGAVFGKGALISWFHAVLAFQESQIDIPVNLKFIIESMHRCDSVGLEDFLATKRQDFLFDIDYVIMCDTEWIGEKHPCLTYGVIGMLLNSAKQNPYNFFFQLTGLVHFDVTYEKVEGSSSEIRDDAEILTKEFQIALNARGRRENVSSITPDEEKLYSKLVDVNLDDYRYTKLI